MTHIKQIHKAQAKQTFVQRKGGQNACDLLRPSEIGGHDHAPSAGEMETGLEQTLWPVEVAGRHTRFRAQRLRMGIQWGHEGTGGIRRAILWANDS